MAEKSIFTCDGCGETSLPVDAKTSPLGDSKFAQANVFYNGVLQGSENYHFCEPCGRSFRDRLDSYIAAIGAATRAGRDAEADDEAFDTLSKDVDAAQGGE